MTPRIGISMTAFAAALALTAAALAEYQTRTDDVVRTRRVATAASHAPNNQRGCPGDVTGDGRVDQDDLDIVIFYLGCPDDIGCFIAGGWTGEGDVDGDGDVDQDDLDVVLFNFGCG